MLITHEREKLADAIIYFVRNTKYCGITKLFKLLFFFDFIHFRETGRSVTGLRYVTWKKGPAPNDLWFEIQSGLKDHLASAVTIHHISDDDAMRLSLITPKRNYDGRFFTKRELRILNDLSFIFLEAGSDQMVEITHLKNSPWHKTLQEKGLNAPIEYWLAADGSDDKQLDIEYLKLRVSELNEARKALS